MSIPAPKKPAARVDLEHPWLPGDAIPAPEAILSDGESAWALWHEVAHQHEQKFAPTAPMSVPQPLAPEERAWAPTQPPPRGGPAVHRREAQPLFTLESAMLVARRNNRVCPRPEQWTEFSALLPPRKTARGVSKRRRRSRARPGK